MNKKIAFLHEFIVSHKETRKVLDYTPKGVKNQ
jgi:hypothetical protein